MNNLERECVDKARDLLKDLLTPRKFPMRDGKIAVIYRGLCSITNTGPDPEINEARNIEGLPKLYL